MPRRGTANGGRDPTKTGRSARAVAARRAGLAERFAEEPFVQFLSSPFVRCVQTLEPLAEARGLTIEPLDQLAEGKPWEYLEKLILQAEGEGPTAVCVHGDVFIGTDDRPVRTRDLRAGGQGLQEGLGLGARGARRRHRLGPTRSCTSCPLVRAGLRRDPCPSVEPSRRTPATRRGVSRARCRRTRSARSDASPPRAPRPRPAASTHVRCRDRGSLPRRRGRTATPLTGRGCAVAGRTRGDRRADRSRLPPRRRTGDRACRSPPVSRPSVVSAEWVIACSRVTASFRTMSSA